MSLKTSDRIIERIIQIILIILIIGLSSTGFLFLVALLYPDTTMNADERIINLIGIILTLITILVGAGSLFIAAKLKAVNELRRAVEEAERTINITTQIALANLPDISLTQHIPKKVMDILREIRQLYNDSEIFRRGLEKNIKVGMALGVLYYGENNIKSIKTLKDLLKMKSVDDDFRKIILYRLGISYRQFGKFGESIKTFDKLRKDNDYNSKKLANIGIALSHYKEFKEVVGYQSSAWLNSRAVLTDNGSECLVHAFERLSEYIDKSEDKFILFYLSQICYDLLKYDLYNHRLIGRNENELKKLCIKLCKKCLDQISIPIDNDIRIYPMTDDFAFLINHILSVVVCYSLLFDITGNDQYKKYCKIAYEKVRNYIPEIGESHSNDLIYSEKKLKEIPFNYFLLDELRGIAENIIPAEMEHNDANSSKRPNSR